MFKNKWSHKFTGGHLFAGRKSVNDRQYQIPPRNVPSTTKKGFLSNIVEEESSEDIPKTFEQEEQYLNECLRSVGGSIEDVQCSEAEEYDFDDFNSIASTASILNLNSDLEDLDRLRMSNSPPLKSLQNSRLSPIRKGTSDQSKNGLNTLLSNDKRKIFEKSISRVQNWDRLGSCGEQDWKKVMLRAAEAGDLMTVQDAVSHLGATKDCLVNARDPGGNTSLHKAAQNGKLQCLRWLVKRAPYDAVSIGNHEDMTPAALATQCGQYECLKWLVEETEASKELEKKNMFSLVHYAAKEGQEECLNYLMVYLSKTKDISHISDSNGITPGHLAAREGHLECLQTLVDYNNDVTLRDKEGFSPSDYAIKAGQTGCAKYLVMVETCLDLSARVKSLSQSLAHARHENEELRNRVQSLETHSNAFMMDRPEVVGEDQSDSSSSTISVKNIIYSGSAIKPYADTRRSSSAPDGESPKGTKKEGGSAFEFHLSPSQTLQCSSMYDVDAQVKSRFGGKMARRRGSYPATHGDENNNIDGAFQPNTWSSQKQENGGRAFSSSRSPSRTPNWGTVAMMTNPVSHVTQRGNEASLLTCQGHSTKLTKSSGFQSPYKSGQSRVGSGDRVLGSDSIEFDQWTPKRNGGEDEYRGVTGLRLKKQFVRVNGLCVAAIETRAKSSSESPSSSDSDFESKTKRRNSYNTPEQAKELRTKRENELRGTSNPANQLSRTSWRGNDVRKVLSPPRHRHDYLRNNRNAPERQAQVSWGDPRIQRRFTIGSSASVENNETYEQVLSHPSKSLYKPTQLHDMKQPFSTQFEKNGDKPWYETEEVEL